MHYITIGGIHLVETNTKHTPEMTKIIETYNKSIDATILDFVNDVECKMEYEYRVIYMGRMTLFLQSFFSSFHAVLFRFYR